MTSSVRTGPLHPNNDRRAYAQVMRRGTASFSSWGELPGLTAENAENAETPKALPRGNLISQLLFYFSNIKKNW
jgi:hypothetical protein